MYLVTSPREPSVAALVASGRVGVLAQPGSNPPLEGEVWAADNGCFSPGRAWYADRWLAWLERQRPLAGACLFAAVPDRVGDHRATLRRWGYFSDAVRALGFAPAFVGQDGQTVAQTPWDELGALFIGGTTAWKLSEEPRRLADEALARGLWVHVGRVNSGKRFRAWAPHAHSCDGSFLSFAPAGNVPRLVRWLDHHEHAPTLWEAP